MGVQQAIQPGFTDPVDDANLVFRRVLDALARPGSLAAIDRPADVPPGRLGRAAIGVAQALVDFETPVWLDEAAGLAAAHLRFHCNCPVTATPAGATFLFAGEPKLLPPLETLPLGSDAYPDQGATLVMEVEALGEDGCLVLSGPGIDGSRRFGVAGLAADFWAQRAALAPLFPRGLDLILTAGDRLAAIPRTTLVRED